LRSSLWPVPAVLVGAAVVLFAVTYGLDQAASRGDLTLPSWINQGSADASRQILSAIAAADITVVGVVFSITIVSLTLASQQFGPRMLRNFMRDRGTQYTLGVFVATFVYAVLALGSIDSGPRPAFVPHLSISVALVLVVADLGVLIYFIHHIAVSIQLPVVIAGIARDLNHATAAQLPPGGADMTPATGPSAVELLARLDSEGVAAPATRSGYLQAIDRRRLINMATEAGAVIRFLYHPGHFVIEGRPLAVVWPADAAPVIARELHRAHATGPQRTLRQDLLFAIDQLAEIAIRALSPAVNDTFTALTCIDWLGDGLCRISSRPARMGIYRDGSGQIRLIEAVVSYPQIVNRAFDKIRQAGRGSPAVAIRQLDSIAKIAGAAVDDDQRDALRRQADLILEASEQSILAEADRADVQRRYREVISTLSAKGPVSEQRP
jgi:uncharacterized membrane protein